MNNESIELFIEYIHWRLREAGKDHQLKMRALAIANAIAEVALKVNDEFDVAEFYKRCGVA